jgi:hypothetical protein
MFSLLEYKLKITRGTPDNKPDEIIKINNKAINELNPFDFNESLGSMYVIETLTSFYFISEKKYRSTNPVKITIDQKLKPVLYKLSDEISISSTVETKPISTDNLPNSFVINNLDKLREQPDRSVLYSKDLDIAICLFNICIFPFPFPYNKKDWKDDEGKDGEGKDDKDGEGKDDKDGKDDEGGEDGNDEDDEDGNDEDDEDGLCNNTFAIIELIRGNLLKNGVTEDLSTLFIELIKLLQEFYYKKDGYILEKMLKEKENSGGEHMIIDNIVKELEDGYTSLEQYLNDLFKSIDLSEANNIKDMMKPIFLEIISTMQDITNEKMVNTYSKNIVASKKKITMFRIIRDCKDLIKTIQEIIFKSIFYILAENNKSDQQNQQKKSINNNEMTLLLEPFFRSEMMSNQKVSEVKPEQLQSIIDKVVKTTKKINKITSELTSLDDINNLLKSLLPPGVTIFEFPLEGSIQNGKSLFDYDDMDNNCPPITNNMFQKQLIVIATTVLEELV